jgi:hypothetical protein
VLQNNPLGAQLHHCVIRINLHFQAPLSSST